MIMLMVTRMIDYNDDAEVIPRSLAPAVLKGAGQSGYQLMVEEFDVPLEKMSAFLSFMSIQY